ncbi:hypothetical protein O6H91_12G078400 [Diphasiastrum complanatum]|uniref:Uncharacterized protein n=1 Tax=Diphasiastrum complanatum TaxID=34168 RepID=A0ACC2C400_DIPCM|nr:hypothetical protein O6H91_12G078400 [Diphasiastrum complanatum]
MMRGAVFCPSGLSSLTRGVLSATYFPSIHPTSLRCTNFATGIKQSRPNYGALLVDVGGTLLETTSPIAETYATFGVKYGVKVNAEDIKKGFKKAFAEPWPERLRYEGDGKRFWKFAVATATGCHDQDYFEELYQHFAKGEAWTLAIGAHEALSLLRDAGVKLAVVSNFDSRLRPLLEELHVTDLFDAIVVSSEIGYEKPAQQIFQAALDALGASASQTVHVGDDPIADKIGAKALGIDAWLWKNDVKSFQEVAARILPQH